MRASVSICTHNRAIDTMQAVESVLNGDMGSADYEILVIDNNSTDNTKELFDSLNMPAHVRYIFEPQLGLSYARNRAIKEAKGEFVLFLDDDALACSTWIKEVVRIFDMDSRIGCVGGKIVPIWEGGKPDWIPHDIVSLYTLMDFSSEIVEMHAPSIPFGANVAFRRSIFQQIKPFREDLGRVGSNLMSSEESELIGRVRLEYKVFYSPYAIVEHKIAKSRLTKRWLLRRVYWQGISDATRYKKSGWGIFKHTVRIVQAALLILISFNNVQKVMSEMAKISYRNGTIVGSFRNSRGLNT
ncbi:glycosyltransferase [Paenibacillus sp. UMB7766-LJ446]|uniref:glycosyltransferase n=1 Tax=Paenibacillus sp. UMB7766-LJ446 TaxID=3046313 RepID=UPI00254BDC12|nr:glycosyltransferase [Paenibacillus sp. UMB7766-LJ446]MDK8191589.1 glycosyltransferase [Paenibacillus sp. UMB7766-LJ446]